MLYNHPPQSRMRTNPRIAIVGLCPGATQLNDFTADYRASSDYGTASVKGAFADLAPAIIAMFRGLGLTEKLGLQFSNDTFSHHPDVYATSLIACASLTTSGSSTAFDPTNYTMASRCIGERFVNEMLSPRFSRLREVFILGTHGWKAIQKIRCVSGVNVLDALRRAGKRVMCLPHPSGSNREYVNLAVLPADKFPTLDAYLEIRAATWSPETMRVTKDRYLAKRETYWRTIDQLRREIAALGPSR